MGWGKPKSGTKFRVCVYIVDDTYWDDGNRTTSRDHDFADLVAAHEFLIAARKKGCYETTSLETGKPLRRHLGPDAFHLLIYDAAKATWRKIDDDEILTLISMV